ncbi:MAG: hypothetical protein UR18_C0006G0017 [Candidatus Nomurabacteria bacterium GW2011_GWE2_31_40]|nr:MAG: hypothetical protein UR18_C0006G0017 [Candidatus Nomurabacteria bacterium GW2011_GWE2_31_40]OGV06207.1 MAG: hypothetical protein A2299_12275 [Stygiobacter sp. RIFOXYB2_FULL_37_11]OGV15957.1 MAG: hypothetical protein A2440_03205 [Stygiobacter sp. RIFOXYC2_FULL_38_25]OGV27901.1 MAG: hypothetical protein A2499_17310 [Stygiobacter sp. RIFOXYC12_FULL_38_8]OGV80434.1 MAG: hypothetical protein A2X65_04365 [Stygiobacter sp. GWF2_38_21]
MSYIDTGVLKSFYQENSFMVKQEDFVNIESIVKQIDGIIKSKLGVDTPATPETANVYLQNIACRICLWYIAGKEGVTKESWDYQKRKNMYQDAMSDLDKIKSGEDTLYDSTGAAIVLTSALTPMFESTKRITGIL